MYDIYIFTDGSCLKNPGGYGGYAFKLYVKNNEFKSLHDYEFSYKSNKGTTNNKMELAAILIALRHLESFYVRKKIYDSKIIILSDSKYCVDIFNKYIQNWISNNFNGAIKNKKLIIKIYNILKVLESNNIVVTLSHIYGHRSDNSIESIYNNKVDILAKNMANYNKNNKDLI